MAAELKEDYPDNGPSISGIDNHDGAALIPIRNNVGYQASRRDDDDAIDDAVDMILNSTDPFWGNLITKLYREGFSIQQMQEAFSVPKQSFKWYGQLTIWFQESKPTCIEQIEFQNGKGPDEEYVNGVIQRLLETHCSEPEPEPQPPPQPATVAVSMPLANIEQGNPGPNQ